MTFHKSIIWDRIITYILLGIIFGLFAHYFAIETEMLFGSDGFAIIWLIVHSLIVMLFMIRLQLLKFYYFKNHIWLLVFVCFISILWATDPMLTLRRCILLTSTTFLGIILAEQFEIKDILRVIVFLVAASLFFSLLLWVVDPSLVEMSSGHNKGSFRGISHHKNYFGRLLVVGVIAGLVSLKFEKRKVALLALVVFMAASVFLTSSIGSVLLLLAVIFFYIVLNRLKKIGIDKAILLVLGVVIFSLSIINYEEVLLIVGKSPTLTNRTILWGFVILEIIKEPLIGYGYSGFWLGEEGPSASIYKITRETIGSTWEAPHAHNGYLDIMLDLGALGLLIFLVGFWIYTRRSYVYFLKDRTYAIEFALIFLLFTLITNLVESQILVENEFMWVMYSYCIALVDKHKRMNSVGILGNG